MQRPVPISPKMKFSLPLRVRGSHFMYVKKTMRGTTAETLCELFRNRLAKRKLRPRH